MLFSGCRNKCSQVPKTQSLNPNLEGGRGKKAFNKNAEQTLNPKP